MSNAIKMANDHIQNGYLSILPSTKYNPLLGDCRNFDINDCASPNFEQEWGRIDSRNESASMYDETYVHT